jgi:hypothetical protein
MGLRPEQAAFDLEPLPQGLLQVWQQNLIIFPWLISGL